MLALWRGRPYDEFADEEWARAEVARLEELRASAVEHRNAALLEAGRPAPVRSSRVSPAADKLA